MFFKVAFETIYQERNPVPAHLAAFGVEVKVNVLESTHPKFIDDLFKGKFDRFLMTRLIDQVHKDHIAIHRNLFLKVFSRRFNLSSVNMY